LSANQSTIRETEVLPLETVRGAICWRWTVLAVDGADGVAAREVEGYLNVSWLKGNQMLKLLPREVMASVLVM